MKEMVKSREAYHFITEVREYFMVTVETGSIMSWMRFNINDSGEEQEESNEMAYSWLHV